MIKLAVLPVRLDSYTGKTSALEAHFFKDREEYAAQSVPDDHMWIAVWIKDGKVEYDTIDYGFQSLEELLETYKTEKIIGLKEDRKDADLEKAREIAEAVLASLLAKNKDIVALMESEIGEDEGAISKAFRTLRKARAGRVKKVPEIDREEVSEQEEKP